jgi:glycosyltransferase involved in cell wall biosynthesis
MRTSVALCTCNGGKYIARQLQSIAEGTVLPDEIVVCDDRSTDDTLAQIERFATATPEIPLRLFVNETRLGSTHNFEKAIGLCQFDIVFLCDQDDVWHAERIERSLQVFEDPAVGGVFSDAELVDDNLNPLGQRMFAYLCIRHFIEQDHADLFGRLLFQSCVTGATLAFRRELAERVRPFPASRFFIHDGWLALTIAAMAKLEVIDAPLISYRQHAGQQVGTMLSGIQQPPAGSKQVIRYPLTRREYAEFYDELAPLLETLPLRQEAHMRFAEAVAHNDQRLAMRNKTVARPFAIARELISGRYHRYSSGLQSAAKDMIRPQ